MIGLVLFQAAVIILIAYYILLPVVIYFNDPKKLRRFPSVSLSAFSNSWMVIHQYLCSRTIAIHLAHQKYGPVVRIGTDHISLSSQQAIKDIYGHGTPTRKDNFYKAYVGTHLNVSDSQDKAVHGAKRKRFAVAFAQKSITELEYVVTDHLEKLIKKLDQKCFETSTMTEKGSLRLTNQQGEVIDLKLWLSFLTLDINSVLLYSTDFTFLDKESTVTTAETINGKLYEADVKRAIWESNHISTSLGWAPRALQLNKFLTKWHRGIYPFLFSS
jgi:benzoate 4-monooxygenase